MIILKNWRFNYLNLIAGASLTLTFAPFNCWYLAFISVAIFYFSLQKVNPKQAFINGFLFGFGLFITAVSWVFISVHQYGDASIWLASFLTFIFCTFLASFFALQSWLWIKLLKSKQNIYLNLMSFASLWLMFEFLRRWLFGGFPWAYLGYSQTDSHLLGFAPVGGVYLISFFVVMLGGVLTSFWLTKEKKKLLILGIIAISVNLGGIILQQIKWTSDLPQNLNVSLIQGNIDQKVKWDNEYVQHQLDLHQSMALNAPPSDIIVMPENAVPIFLDMAQDYLADIYIQRPNSTIVTGAPYRMFNEQKKIKYYNSLVVQNEVQAVYLKQQLVPFGEFMPLENLLRGIITFFDLPMSDFAAGDKNQPPLLTNNIKIAAFICYEAAYPDLVARLARDSGFLLTISNDTWFGGSIGPKQHLQMAQMRAVENARPLVRATNNGITAFVDKSGKIQKVAPQFEPAILTAQITPQKGNTPYMLWRDYPLFLLNFFFLLWLAYRNKKLNKN